MIRIIEGLACQLQTANFTLWQMCTAKKPAAITCRGYGIRIPSLKCWFTYIRLTS